MNKQPILIVEDEPNIAGLIENYLNHAGFATIRAADGRQALDLIRDESLRLVILDLLLPEIDGWSVAHELRRHSDIPFLILSAQKDEIDRVIDVHIGKLRRKLEHDSSWPRLIHTVRGVGYRFASEDGEL